MATTDFVVKNGLVVTENAVINETTDASDKDTGALVVEGGVGIEKKLYVGTDLAVGGATTLTGDLAVNGGDITTSSITATVFNANATTLNVGQAATTVSIGAATGTTTINNANTVITGDLAVNGADITTSSTGTATVFNTNATTVNFAGAGTTISIGAATGTTTINNANTVVTGDLAVNGADITTSSTGTATVFNTNATTLNVGQAATTVSIGAITGTTTIRNANTVVTGDLAVNGGDITTSAATATVFNTNATTLNIGQAATTISIGAATGTTTVRNSLDVDGDVNIDGGDLTVSTSTFNLANTTATTVNFAGAATNVQIGAATGTTEINNNLNVVGDVDIDGGDLTASTTTFNLINTTATTVNFAGAGTGVTIGATTGTTTIRNANTAITGDLAVNGGDLTTGVTTFNLLNATATTVNFAGAATDVQIGAATGTTEINNNLNVVGDVDIDGGDLTVSTLTFNLANTTATTVNFAGAATDVQIGAATGTTNINNSLDVDGDVNIDGGDLTVSTGTFNLANTTATTVNFAGAGTTISIGAATGTTTINNTNTVVTGDLAVNGADITTSSTGTATLFNANATTLNIGQAATTVSIGATTGTTTVRNSLAVNGNTTLGDATGDTITFNSSTATVPNTLTLTVDDAVTNNISYPVKISHTTTGTPANGIGTGIQFITETTATNNEIGMSLEAAVTDVTATSEDFDFVVKLMAAGAAAAERFRVNSVGNVTVVGDLAVNGGDITTTATTATVFNTTATTVNFAGAGTTISIGAATGTTTINNANTVVTGDLAINGGDLTTSATTFNLVNTTATTVNFAGAGTTIGIGAVTGTTTVNNALTVSGAATVNNTAVISANSTTAALRITQIGTGNALVVEDEANPDATPFVVAANGAVRIGSLTSYNTAYAASQFAPGFQLYNTVGTAGFYRYSADTDAPALVMSKSRSATVGTQTIVNTSDTLGYLGFTGSDGTNFITGAHITAQVDGTPGTNDMPGRLVFSTTADGASSPTERMRINNAGNVGIGTTAPAGKLDVAGDIISQTSLNGTGTFWFQSKKSRGTVDVPTTVLNGDGIGGLLAIAYQSSYRSYAAISFNINGTVSTNTVPTDIVFTALATGAPVSGSERMRIASTGIISLGAAPGAESLRVTPVTSAVNYLEAQGQVTTGGPSLIAAGSDTNIDLLLKTKGTGAINQYTNGSVLQFRVSHTASAVNYLQVTGGATGGGVNFSAQGSDANIFITYDAKGAEAHGFRTNGGAQQFRIAPTASAVNYLQVTGAATSGVPLLQTTGSDTNVPLTIVTKGTGYINLQTGGGTQFVVTNTASAVNYLQVTGAATTATPVLSAVGADTNVNLRLAPKGTGTVQESYNGTYYDLVSQYDIGTNANQIPLNQYLGTMAYQNAESVSIGTLAVTGTTSLGTGSANYLTVTGAATGNVVSISTAGSDTNIGLTLTTKGTGNIILDTGTSTGDIELKPGAANLRLWDDDSSHYYTFVTGNRSANYNINLPAGDVTLVAGTMITSAGGTFTGQIISTLANNTANGGGQIYLNGATGNRIDFNTNGTAAPAFTTRSAGTKIVLFPNIGAAAVDYAIGIESGNIWSSVATTANGFKWYGGTTVAATLTGAGALTLTSNLTVSGGTITTGNVAATLLSGNTTTNITLGSALTSGTFTLGGTATTGTMTIDQSNSAHTLNIASGTNASGVIKTVNIGTGGASGSTTNVTIGASAGSGTTVMYGNVAIGLASTSYRLQVNGSFAATTKSFVIDHPTKPNMKLRYGSLEGPENGVYVRGRLSGSNKIELPDYWTGLVDETTITVNLTAIGKAQDLYVDDIRDNCVYVGGETINCFYTVFAERKDVEKLLVEF